MNKNRLILIITAIILTFMLIISASAQKESLKKVEIATSQKENIYNSIISNGEIVLRDARLLYCDKSAIVSRAYVNVGDKVKKGDKILLLKTTPTPVIDINDESISQLYSQIIRGEITNEDELKDSVMAFAPQNSFQNNEGEYITITAPVSGTIISLSQKNTQVFPSISFGKISDISKLSVKAQIPEEYIADIKIGQKVNITGDAFGESVYSGRVVRIMPYASKPVSFTGKSNKAYIDVMIDIQSKNEELRPGYSVKAKVFTETILDATIVPYECIFQDNDDEMLYIIENGHSKRVKVETGAEFSDGVQITSGISGECVVILNPQNISDGDKVIANA